MLKLGGCLVISDIAATTELPNDVRHDAALITGCIGNALIKDLETLIKDTGFTDIRFEPKNKSKTFIKDQAPDRDITDFGVATTIEAVKL